MQKTKKLARQPLLFSFESFFLSDSTRSKNIGKFYQRKLKKIETKAKKSSKINDVYVVLI